MKILLLPGALKGSLSALRVGQILVRPLSPRFTLRTFPIADGGDGFERCTVFQLFDGLNGLKRRFVSHEQ